MIIFQLEYDRFQLEFSIVENKMYLSINDDLFKLYFQLVSNEKLIEQPI